MVATPATAALPAAISAEEPTAPKIATPTAVTSPDVQATLAAAFFTSVLYLRARCCCPLCGWSVMSRRRLLLTVLSVVDCLRVAVARLASYSFVLEVLE